MLDSDCVEGLEAVDGAKVLAILFGDTEPARAVRRIRSFIHTCFYFYAYDSANFVVDARRNGNVFLDPRGMCDNWNFDWREEVLTKVSTLGVVPSEAFVLECDEVVE